MKKVTAVVEKWTIPTYPIRPAEEMPMFAEKRNHKNTTGNPYPNRVTQRAETQNKTDAVYDIVRLENDYIRLGIIPALGGKVLEAYDKINNYNFLYRQHVVKPALIGAFGAWTSGGLEFNWPFHHRPSTVMPVDFSLEECEDGSAVCWLSECDPADRMKGMVGIVLRPDASYFETRVKVTNRTDTAHSFLWWENGAVRINDEYRIIFPPDVTWVHHHYDRCHTTYPIATGRYGASNFTEPTDISWLKNTDVASSYFAAPSKYDFFGGYDYAADCGTIHVADHHRSPGKKMFTWGSGENADNWERALTDSDGKYCELMAGSYTDDQPDFTWLEPYETKAFSQFWYPIRKTQSVSFANLNGAAAIDREKGEIRINVTREVTNARITLSEAESGRLLLEDTFSLRPCECAEFSAALGRELLCLTVSCADGEELLSYTEDIPDALHIPKNNPGIPTPDHLYTAQDCYLAGVHIDLYRDIRYKPDAYYLEALRYDPKHLPALTALGEYCLRTCRYDEAEKYLNRAMAVQNPYDYNPKDGTVGYLLGLTYLRTGRTDKAYNVLSKAAWSCNTVSKAMTLIAGIDGRCGRFDRMLQHADEALDKESHNPVAGPYAAWALYKLGRADEAKERLGKILAFDCLNQLARYMAIRLSGGDIGEFYDSFKMNSNPSQTCLDVAFNLQQAGLCSEAAEVLSGLEKYRGASTMARYLFGTLLYEQGEKDEAAKLLKKASENPVVDVFPYRPEEAEVLQKALSINPEDGTACYLLGCLLYDKRQYEAAAQNWLNAVKYSPDFHIPYRNLAVACFSHLNKPEEALEYLRKATDLKQDEQLLTETGYVMAALGIPAEERVVFLKERLPENCGDNVVLELTKAYLAAEQYDEAMQTMLAHDFTPGEGGEFIIAEPYMFSRLAPGRMALAEGRPEAALTYFESALTLPENLHVGFWNASVIVPFKYYKAQALKQLGRTEEAEKLIASLTGIDNSGMWNMGGEFMYYAAMLKKLSGNAVEADIMMREAILGWEAELADVRFRGAHEKNDRFFYRSYINDPMALKQADLHFMLGYGMLYLGKKDEAKRYFEKSLSFNPDNIKAALELRFL